MPLLGPAEILVIFVVALLVFGPDKLPEIGRQVGRGVRELRRVQAHLRTELRDVMSELDVPSGGDPLPEFPPKDSVPSTMAEPSAAPSAAPHHPSAEAHRPGPEPTEPHHAEPDGGNA